MRHINTGNNVTYGEVDTFATCFGQLNNTATGTAKRIQGDIILTTQSNMIAQHFWAHRKKAFCNNNKERFLYCINVLKIKNCFIFKLYHRPIGYRDRIY